MKAFEIFIFVVSCLFLYYGIKQSRKANRWRKCFYTQERLLKKQREIITLKESTIQNYKRMMANGVCIIADERKN